MSTGPTGYTGYTGPAGYKASDPIYIGTNAGANNGSGQHLSGIAIGVSAGQSTQATGAIALGFHAGQSNQGLNSIAIGYQAGAFKQGNYAIAIGNQSGQTTQNNSSIILNAQSAPLNSIFSNSFYAAPVRNATGTNLSLLCYDSSSEVTQSIPTSVQLNLVTTTATQLLSHKTFTGPTIGGVVTYTGYPSASLPSGSSGQETYDTTLNLPVFYNSNFWQRLGAFSVTAEAPVYLSCGSAPGNNTNHTPSNGWSTGGGGNTQLTFFNTNNDGVCSIQCTTIANSNYIAYSFGSVDAGLYVLDVTLLGGTDRPLVDILEVNTSTTIKSQLDTYRPGSSSIIHRQYPIQWNTTGTMQVKFLVNGKNTNSTGYALILHESLVLSRIG